MCVKRTKIRNLATRLQRSYSQSGVAHARKLRKIAFVPGSMNNFGPTIRTTTSNLEKGRFSWVRNEHFSGSARCGKRSLRAWWACAAMAVLRAWCEANPTTSMAPASRGWVIGGSRSRLGSGLRWNGWRARPRLGECRFNPHVGPSLHKRFKIRE
jgi:hypothetical protein